MPFAEMFEYLKYKLTGKIPPYSQLLKIANRYGWHEPEIQPAAWYWAEVAYGETGLKAYWNYKKRKWVIRLGDTEIDRGEEFDGFVRALKSWRRRSAGKNRLTAEGIS